MTSILHLTAHLGGGVGKALSGLVMQSDSTGSEFRHTIVTFEKQEKLQFIDQITNCGCNVIVCPTTTELLVLIEAADIVQLEWWNHPATLKALCSAPLPPLRMLTWSHVSGLFNPIFPPGLVEVSDRFIFTSPCSYESKTIAMLPQCIREKLDVVSSSGGFTGFPMPVSTDDKPLAAGYIGSLNFSKLHPQYIDFLAAVNLTDFSVKLIGDTMNRELLEEQCVAAGRPGMLDFQGYTSDPVSALSSINVLTYLLNPEHYGTTENALIEAMAMGIVPVVLDNPAERNIVTDQLTGLVVQNQEEFAGAIQWLAANPAERHAIGLRAAASVRERFTAERMSESLCEYYSAIMELPKKSIDFTTILGNTPAQWFLACQGYPEVFTTDTFSLDNRYQFARYGLFEKSKGTVFHFLSNFPDDHNLKQWATKIQTWQ